MISSTSTLPPSSLQLLSSLQRQVHFQEDVHLIHDSVEDSEDENFYDSAKGLLQYSRQEMQQFKQNHFCLARLIVSQHASRSNSSRRTWFDVIQETYCKCTRQPQESSEQDGLLAEEPSSSFWQRDVQHYFREEYLGLEYDVTLQPAPPDEDDEQYLAMHHNLCHDRCQKCQAMWQQVKYWQQPHITNLVNAPSRNMILKTTCAQLSRPACLLACLLVRLLAQAVAISVQEDDNTKS
eukprot:scaffold151_cov232-Amphora_coffeaeformis.AAC.2